MNGQKSSRSANRGAHDRSIKKRIWKSKRKTDAEAILKCNSNEPIVKSRSSESGAGAGSAEHQTNDGSKVVEVKTAVIPPEPDVNLDDNRYKWSMNLMTTSNTSTLRKEFVKNKKYKPPDYTSEAFKKNEAKNRYDDVICIDSTRVILKERPPDDDYIHANWMVMPDQTKYICTQGPIQETLTDFWQMIFTEKSTVIVMLCAFKEGKNEKCALYHPKTKSECGKFGSYRVYLRESMPNPYNIVNHKVFLVKRGKTNSIEVHHLACSEWPDHTAPLDPGPIVGMMRLARSLAKGNPITVHCSAGIGRSATFVGIDYAMQKIKEDSTISMVDILKELRKQRFQSVQGIIQYIFLHICVLEAFADDGVIDRKGKFAQYMADYTKMLNNFNKKMAAKMQKEKG